MTNTELKALLESNILDNTNRQITPAKMREVLTEFVKSNGSWADYNNSNATQSITADTWTQLTNDGAGIYTNTDYLPYYSSGMFSSNRVQLADIPQGTILTLRFDKTITTLSPNTEVRLRVRFYNSSDVEVYASTINHRLFKNAATRNFVSMYTFYVGSDIVDGSMSYEIYSDNNMTAKWNGVLISIP